MALYSPSELHEILIKLSQEPQIEVKYLKIQRLGILVNKAKEEKSSESDDKEDGQQNICSVCKKKLISAHLLDLHVSENHDSYFDIAKLKKPMVTKLQKLKTCDILTNLFLKFACYLEECKHKSSTPEDRKDHCIKIHKFPHDFRFDKVASKKKSPSNSMDTTEDPLSAAKPKYTTFHFGHKSQKAFTKSRSKRPDPIESMIIDLKESLPEV